MIQNPNTRLPHSSPNKVFQRRTTNNDNLQFLHHLQPRMYKTGHIHTDEDHDTWAKQRHTREPVSHIDF